MSPPDAADREPRPDEDGMAEWVQPGKAIRIYSMVSELLTEVRNARLDEPSRDRLRKIYELSLDEVSGALSADLAAEFGRMMAPFDHPAPSESELRIAQAQLIGWLEGLFQAIQAAIFASSWSPDRHSSRYIDKSWHKDRPPIQVTPHGNRSGPTVDATHAYHDPALGRRRGHATTVC